MIRRLRGIDSNCDVTRDLNMPFKFGRILEAETMTGKLPSTKNRDTELDPVLHLPNRDKQLHFDTRARVLKGMLTIAFRVD